MNRIIHIVVLVFCLQNIFAGEKLIKWNDSIQISKKDFLGEECEGYGALTATLTECHGTELDESTLIVDISCYMDCEKSAYCAEEDSMLTTHELTHFKIREICARRIRTRASKIKSKDKYYIDLKISEIYKEEVIKTEEIDDRYDLETNHGRNHEAQKEWNEKIDKELKSLSKYKCSVIKFKIKNKKKR